MPPDGVASTPAQRDTGAPSLGHTPSGVPCARAAPARRCGLADPVAAVVREVGPPAGTVAQRDGPGRSLARRLAAAVTPGLRVRRSTGQATGAVGTRRPALVMPSRMARTAAVDTARALRQWGGPCAARAAGCGRAARGWERAGGPAAARRWAAPRAQRRRSGPALWGPRSRGPGGHGHRATARRRLAAAVAWACAWSRPPRRRPGSGRWRVCHGRPGPPAGGSRARGRPRWRGRPAPGVAPAVAHADGGAGRSPRAPAAEAPLRGAVAGPGPREGLAGLSGRHPTAGCPASAAPGGAAPGASQRAGGPAGGAAGSPAGRRPPSHARPQAHRPAQAVARRRTAPDRRRDARRACHATTARARLAGRAMARPGHGHPSGARLRRDQPSRGAL